MALKKKVNDYYAHQNRQTEKRKRKVYMPVRKTPTGHIIIDGAFTIDGNELPQSHFQISNHSEFIEFLQQTQNGANCSIKLVQAIPDKDKGNDFTYQGFNNMNPVPLKDVVHEHILKEYNLESEKEPMDEDEEVDIIGDEDEDEG